MYLYVELWKPRAAWSALPAAERDVFIQGIGGAVGGLTEAGIELLGFAFNDGDPAHRADYAWLAVWRMPTPPHRGCRSRWRRSARATTRRGSSSGTSSRPEAR